MVLGLLLARAGVAVTVLEKHADFLRDFRGDTVHASTLTLLDELGLGARFAALPQRRLDRATLQRDTGTVQIGDLSRLPGPHKHIALVPQWDLLDLLADAGETEPTFTLRRNAEVTDLLRENGWVVGARFTDPTDGSVHEVRAVLTVACDGRGSAVPEAAGPAARGVGGGRGAAEGVVGGAEGRVVFPAPPRRGRPRGRRRAHHRRRVHGDD